MQPNEITLSVDALNNGTPVNRIYTRFDEYQNRSVYVGPNHSISARDTLSLYRTQPKPSGNFKGVAKTALKFSEDKVVTGTDGLSQLTAPIIGDIAFSIPVGVSNADILAFEQRLVAALDHAIMRALNETLMI